MDHLKGKFIRGRNPEENDATRTSKASFETITRARAKDSNKALALPSAPKLDEPKPTEPEKSETEITRDEATGKLTIPQDVWRKIEAGFGKSRAGSNAFLTLIALAVSPDCHDLMAPYITNFCIDVASSIGPRDHVEVMLVNQMIGTHWNAMALLSTKPRDAVRLLRAFTAQVEALRNYRRKGEQRMIIEHVTVEAGGQAVVGNVVTGDPKNEGGSKNGR